MPAARPKNGTSSSTTSSQTQISSRASRQNPRGNSRAVTFNSARPNLLHTPSCSHVAWSSIRIIINLCLAAEACGIANQYLLAGTLPADVNIATLQIALTARGLLIAPL
ncbi:hypothetical protein [Pararhizobium sp. LjRoot238]|uniref:hypothetical protein n=1 Tax=Pararhizobium sp. LjRoot238 TaxID=3342293 RepID=UPI003ED0FDB3